MRKILKNYVEAAAAEKEAKTKKDHERYKVEKFLRRCQRKGLYLEYISMTEASRFNLKDEELLEYLRSVLPKEDLEKATKVVPDLAGMTELIIDGKLDSTLIPSTCYNELKYNTVKINYKKL